MDRFCQNTELIFCSATVCFDTSPFFLCAKDCLITSILNPQGCVARQDKRHVQITKP